MSQDINFTITESNPQFSLGNTEVNFSVDEVVLEFPQALSQINFEAVSTEIKFVLHGNTGQAGGEEVPYAQQVDFVDGSPEIIYRAEAPVGSATATAIWRIRKITVQSSDGDIMVRWANGSEAFNQIWDDHLGLSYS